MDWPPDALDLVRRQWGIASTQQLTATGVSRSAVRSALQRHWDLVLPGVVHVDRSPLRPAQRHLAALLYAGDSALIGGASAAAWWGVTAADDHGIVDVAVPASQVSRRVRWAQLRRTHVMDPAPAEDGDLRYASAARSTVDAARAATTDDHAVAIVIEAVQRRLTTVDRLAAINDTLAIRGSARARRAIDLAATGAWSVPEVDLAVLVEASPKLPPMWCNPMLTLADGTALTRPDGWFDDVGLAVMIHSQKHHALGRGWERTIERDGDLRAAGVHVLPITPIGLRRHPDETLARIEKGPTPPHSDSPYERRFSPRGPGDVESGEGAPGDEGPMTSPMKSPMKGA